jgi:ABC-2 type transport system ATP-binding protein
MAQAAIEIDNLHYSYRSDFLVRRIEALRGISLRIEAGEAFGYLGPNGAGKTTTIKCVLGLIRPSAGKIAVNGFAAGSKAARSTIGYLAEQPYFYDYLTVQETMGLFATLAGLRGQQAAVRIGAALERVGMTERSGSRMRSLSKGLTQRVALAQALVAEPTVVILDEPFSGLDPIGRREFREIFLELKQRGVTIFMSSHVLGDVEHLCDRASITVKGKLQSVIDLRERKRTADRYEIIAANSLPETLIESLQKNHPELTKTEFSEGRTVLEIKGERSTQEVLRMLVEQKITIAHIEQRQPSLEELFMNIVESK